MIKNAASVYQFKITLYRVSPFIWRRILIPEIYTFWDLHVAIQDAMGWMDSHLHRFEVINFSAGTKEEIGMSDEEFGSEGKVLSGWEQKIAHYFSTNNPKMRYIYDFGDNWEHEIEFEDILPQENGVSYPVCVAGERACPPEDCGGVPGYQNFLDAINDPSHEQHEEMIEWAGGEFDSEYFDVKVVHFDDPEKRWKLAFG